MTAIYNKNAKKKATNISINSDLLEKAKQYKINISANVEKTLEALIYEYEKANWEEQNRVAIDDYNKRVKKEGLFSDHFRSF
ncbi:type II toxin-antitoxin system CcdA family antitoxin [Arcobacter porcinus]|mgnify:FL=1|jgi:antitoxin CcdA|uniref:Post-segregation antitoxin CcdA n=1 Tax=Arcobacter porcinus TaxID=1935204 RepID=A0ABX2YJG5_9BACT|nr:type II toxin-antitoxin system CcdA family antitoxin [Arcobacter porcinus]OCL82427.1 Post-segregation antitoxin CcdA [Arcobacter porcinus]OCL93342.1 Post-segregation antitoxin CcdA [Arcobacter porcinus]